jgi:hypothetical protein
VTTGRKAKESREKRSPTNPTGEARKGDELLRQRIAEKAYELYQKRGQSHGRDLNDWLEAERLVLSEIESEARSTAKKPRRKER